MARPRNKYHSRLHALLGELEADGIGMKISASNASELLDRITVTDEAVRFRILVARELVEDITRIDDALKASKKRFADALAASGTSLTNIVGVGPIGAATIIGYTRDVTRFPTKGHYATCNATAPIVESSAGNTGHRLNLRRNRILNHAIRIAAVTQMRHDTNFRVYFDKKIVESKTSREAVRALKRRISDAVYRAPVVDVARPRRELKRVGPRRRPGTTLSPAWPACILKADSFDKPLPEPDTNATPIPQHRHGIDSTRPQPPRKDPRDTKGFDMCGDRARQIRPHSVTVAMYALRWPPRGRQQTGEAWSRKNKQGRCWATRPAISQRGLSEWASIMGCLSLSLSEVRSVRRILPSPRG